MKTKANIYFLLFLFAVLTPLQAWAFNALRGYPPLLLAPSENAYCMMFDHRGVLWIGTNNGLKSYDGYELRTYRSDAYAPNKLPNNTVRSLAEDCDDGLWVGTRNGLLRMDLRTGQTTTYHLPADNQRIIYTLYVAPDGRLWVGTDGGLSVLDRSTGRFYTYNNKNTWLVTEEGRRLRMTDYSVKSILQAPNGDLLVGTWSADLLRLRKGTHTFYRYPSFNDGHSAYSLCMDRRHRLWVGTWGYGVARIDNPDDVRHPRVTHYPYASGNFDIFLGIVEDPVTHSLWAATREGICTLYPDDGTDTWKRYTAIDGYGLDYCYGITTDRMGNVWVLTQNNGIIQTTFSSSPFTCVDLPVGTPSFPVNFVSALYTPDGNTFWLGLNPYGVACYDRRTGQARFNHAIPGFASLPDHVLSTSFSSIIRRYNGDLWFADNSYGLVIKPADGDAVALSKDNTPWMYEDYVNTLYESRDRTVWVGQRSGLSMVAPDGRGYQVRLVRGREELSNCDIRGISEDRQGTLWLATDNEGIIRVRRRDRGKATLAVEQYSPRHGNLAVDDATKCLEDKGGRLWAISNSGGLFLYNRTHDRFDAKMRDYHLAGDRVLAIAEDKRGGLWLTTDQALVRLTFDGKGDTPTDVSYYTREDGLGDMLFSEGTVCSHGGELYLGSRRGFIAFDPSRLARKRTETSNLIITDLIVDDEPFRLMTDSALQRRISSETPSFTRKVTLPASVKKIAFDFALLSFGNTRKNIYSYMLEGYDDDWHFCGGESHSAVFQNLPSGTYHLRVRAKGNGGQWVEMGYSITVRVLPPWYASWWAWLVYLGLASAAVVATVQWYRNHLRTQNRLRMGMVLTNITHELLTPLTVIYATIFKLRSQAPQYSDEYQVMENNIQRTKRLLSQLLEVRKSQAGQLRLRVSRGDIAAFVRQEAEEIAPMAVPKRVELRVSVPGERTFAWFDTDKLDKILYNLLSNAIKYNRDGGSIDLGLTVRDNAATLTVRDTGIGMSRTQLSHLYTRFFDGDYRRQNTGGTGIGLALVHELVGLHHGRISCESTEGEGTCFTVVIPTNKSAYAAEEIDTSVVSKAVDSETAKMLTDGGGGH